MPPAPSVRTNTFFPGRDASTPGNAFRAVRATVMWSAAVFDPALPLRSSIVNGSPAPPGPWSTNATNGWNP